MRKGNNIAITLSRMKKLSPAQIASSILTAKEGVITTENLQTLARFIPTSEELDSIKAYSGDKIQLGVAEKFYLEISLIPRLDAKIQCLILRDQFADRLGKIINGVTFIINAANQVVESKSLSKLLEGTLIIANYLNSGSKFAQAYGFSLDSLPKIWDVRANGKRTTILHYVIGLFEQSEPSLTQLSQELKDVSSAVNGMLRGCYAYYRIAAPVQVLEDDLDTIKYELKRMSHELKTVDETSTAFRNTVTTFYIDAQQDLERVAQLFNTMRKATDTMLACYGFAGRREIAGPLKNVVDEFFETINTAIKQFERAQEELEQLKQSQARILRAAKERDIPEQKGGVLDNLFASIRAGSFVLKKAVTEADDNSLKRGLNKQTAESS